jgi:hypothetical protein
MEREILWSRCYFKFCAKQPVINLQFFVGGGFEDRTLNSEEKTEIKISGHDLP